MAKYVTKFGSLDSYEKGGIEIINDDPKHYVFSNIFEVANSSKPWEKVAVGKNMEYVIEAIRAEGTSEWRTCAHDEFPTVLDGEVTIELVKLDKPQVDADHQGSVKVNGEPVGKKMGRIVLRRGHQALLPANSAYRFTAKKKGVMILQTIHGDDTIERWADICPGFDTETTMTDVKATKPNAQGYKEFSIGGFNFRRDEFFAHITWPTGKHVMSADSFPRALQRDVAWDFFYGTVNFDHVFGTVNHYGNVDVFAGRFNDVHRKAELDHTENFDSATLRKTFEAMLDDWTNSSFDPFASPAETDKPFGEKNGSNTDAVTRRRVAAARMVGVPGDEEIRTDKTHPVNRMFADVPQDEPEVYPEPGFENEVAAFSLFAYLSRSDVTWNPSVVSICKASLYCPTTEEYILPIVHGNDRVEWFIQLSDEIVWDVQDRDTGAPRAKVTMKAGDVAAMPADIRHQGYSPKRSMLLVWENADPGLPERISKGLASVHAVQF